MRYNKKSPVTASIQMVTDNNKAGLMKSMIKHGYGLKGNENITKKMAVLSKLQPTKTAQILSEVPINSYANNYTTDPNFINQMAAIKTAPHSINMKHTGPIKHIPNTQGIHSHTYTKPLYE